MRNHSMRKSLFYVLLLFAISTFINGTVTAQDLSDGLEGYWSFDEYEGDVAIDLSDNGRDAPVTSGEPLPSAGKVGNAVFFDGNSDFTVPWKGIGGNDPRSITFWVKTSTDMADDLKFMGWGTAANGRKWHILANPNADNGVVGAIRIAIAGSFIIGTKIINDGEWHHIAATFEGEFIEGVTFYVDGELDPISGTGDTELPVDTAVGNDGQDVLIGSRFEGGFDRMVGTLDEVRIYNRVISEQEIIELYEQGNVDQVVAQRSLDKDLVISGEELQVTLTIPTGVDGTLTDRVSEGWTISNPSDGGTVDGNTVTWELTPSITEVSYTATLDDGVEGDFFGRLNGIVTSGERQVRLLQSGVGEFESQADIGLITLPGMSEFDGQFYRVYGGGDNIGGTMDAFHFLFNEIEGPFSISGISFLDVFEGDTDVAKGGLMIRNNLTAGSSNAFNMLRSQDLSLRAQYRTIQDDSTGSSGWIGDQIGEMRLERLGQQIDFYYTNFDGEEVLLESVTLVDLEDPVYTGIAITSHSLGTHSIHELEQLEIDLIPFSSVRTISFDEGVPGFGDTLQVEVSIYQRNAQDIMVTETPPSGWQATIVDQSAGEASINDNGEIVWTIGDHQGDASLTYEVITPTDVTEPVITGTFSGNAAGNDIQGDSEVEVRGLLPQELLDNQDITSGLEGYWNFDDGEGATVADISGNDREGTVFAGEPQWVEGVSGTALQFDGDDGIEIPTWKGIGGADPRTITAWVKTDPGGSADAFVSWGTTSGDGAKWHILIPGSGLLRCAIAGSNINGNTILTDGEWHFTTVVVPEGGSVMQDVLLYVDGIEENISNITTLDVPINTITDEEQGALNVRLGSRVQGSDRFFVGTLDEIRIYNRGLSAAEIQAVMVADGGYPTDIEDFMLY